MQTIRLKTMTHPLRRSLLWATGSAHAIRILGVALALSGAALSPAAMADDAEVTAESAPTDAAQPAADEATAPVDETAPADAQTSDTVQPASADAAEPASAETIPVAETQPAAPAEAPVVAQGEGGTMHLDDVVVTATKRRQTVREIPTTVNVLSGEKLEGQGARQISDYIDQIPGIKMEDQAGVGPRKIAVRGVGPDDNTNQTVGVVLGDVPLGDPYGSYTIVDPDPFDLGTVEVLKGPQGSLFGASSLSGLVRFVPNAPVLDTWQGKTFAEWSSIQGGGSAPTYGAMINVPVGSTLALRGAGVLEHAPGYINYDTPGYVAPHGDDSRKTMGRVMALWQPTDKLTINLLGMSQRQHGDQMSWVTNGDYMLSRDDSPGANPFSREFQMASLDARYAFDWATLVSLSGYEDKANHFDQDLTYNFYAEPVARQGLTLIRALRDVRARGFVQEVRLVSPDDDGPWNWLAGAFYSRYNAHIESNVYIPYAAVGTQALGALTGALGLGDLSQGLGDQYGVTFGKQVLNPLEAGERALFGELSRTFGSLKLTLGGRYYRTEVTGTSASSGVAATAANQMPVSYAHPEVQGKGFSPKLALAWEVSRDMLIYTSAARGFQFGGINVVPIPLDKYPATYDSSTLWSYEAGIRTDWLDRTLRADFTLFYLDWKNAQVYQVGSTQADSWVTNVGAVKSQGAEATVRYLFPWEGLSLELSGAYLDARTKVPFTGSKGDTVEKGTVMPNSPPLQTSTTLAYAKPIFDTWMTTTAFIYTHSNSGWNNIEHDAKLDVRDTLNLNLSVARIDGTFRPTFGFVVTNLTNQIDKVSAAVDSGRNTLQGNPFLYTRPRTVQAKVSVDF